ncbi:tetratricopeptide repeat protein [Thauera sp. AutoDN2]|uniref:tetratricopeptide repeat protein n=1 Tax=Thauera sp. AutoDN2 TaxID=3416051 RepID=UPI003F4BDF78
MRTTETTDFSKAPIARVVLALCAGASISLSAHGSTTPTEMEWLGWPDFCKAGYLASGWGGGSGFQGRMPHSQVESLRRQFEITVGIPGVHHFCVGMLYVNRAKAMPSGNKRTETLRSAVSEIDYSFSRATPSAPMYSLITAYYGTALYRQGKRQEANAMWDKGIQAKPNARESYLAKAEVLITEKKHREALDVLLKYEKAKETDYADAEYFLGHVYFELKQYEKAREHADKAYKLGYPFPGLLRKLERVGK